MNTALNELIVRLKHEASQIEHSVKQQTRERDKWQEMLDHGQERLLSKRELIEYLEASAFEASAPLDTEWQIGDRFEWVDERYHNRGTVKIVTRTDGGDYIQYVVTTDAGSTLIMGSEFETAARKVES